ncbi:MAG: hypothetical protein Tsb0021_01850 [Chlamydiales bacterium]
MKIFLSLLGTLMIFTGYSDEKYEIASSVPEQVATLHCVDDLLVGNLVCPMTGQISAQSTDLIVQGAIPISVNRVYVSPHIKNQYDEKKDVDLYTLTEYLRAYYRGWVIFPEYELAFSTIKNESFVRLPLSNGITLDFKIAPDGKCKLNHEPYGIHNWGSSGPSGKYDYRNISITLLDYRCTVKIDFPDGTQRYYRGNPTFSEVFPQSYSLFKEIQPSGHIRFFSEEEIQSLSPNEKHCYATLKLERKLNSQNKPITSCSNGVHEARYTYCHPKVSGKCKFDSKHQVNYEVTLPPQLITAEHPFTSKESIQHNERYLLTAFESDQNTYYCTYDTTTPFSQVSCLKNAEGKTLYTFHYEPPEPGEKGGSTTVIQNNSSSKIYHYSKDLLLEKIEYHQDHKLIGSKNFHWNPQNWLESIEICTDQLIAKITYTYDSYGNPIEEILSGSLTEPGCQKKLIQRLFSQDGFNLLLKESHQEGPTYLFSYLEGTNLLTQKKTLDAEGNLLKEETYTYDENHHLIEESHMNGDSCLMTRYILRQEDPFMHMPEWIEQRTPETLLKKAHLFYDRYGNVCQEDIYNGDGDYVYTLTREYDARGHIVRETNPIGQYAEYHFDDKGCLTAARPFAGNLVKEQDYDLNNRLIREREIGDTTHTTSYRYDLYGNLSEKTDYLRNTTRYEHHPHHHRVIKELHPLSTTYASYDVFGRCLSKTDANGNTTRYTPNAIGKPLKIDYPDGTSEYYTYTLHGDISTHRDQENHLTKFTYDVLGNLRKKEYFDSLGNFLACEEYHYKGSYLIAEIDKEGHQTHYHYDLAGRLVKKERLNHLTTYTYDSLGRQVKEVRSGETPLIIDDTYDLLDRLIQRDYLDRQGNRLKSDSYTYDEAGNIHTKTRNGYTETTTYDPFSRKLTYEDPAGALTIWKYLEKDGVLQMISQNPKGTLTIRTYDSLGRLIEKESLLNQTLSFQKNTYDPHGNLIREEHQRFTKGTTLETQILSNEYDSRHRLVSSTRAYGTPHSRTTRYAYTPKGQVAAKTLPDETVIHYVYTPLGHLKTLNAPDVHQTFHYNKMGQLIGASDNNTSFERLLDPFGNVLEERFSHGITVRKTYDAFDRPLTVSIPGKTINYTYDPCYLRTVKYNNHIHHCISYDLSGNLLEECLSNGTHVRYRYNPNQKLLQIDCPQFKEYYHYNTSGELIQRNTELFAYDPLSQLEGHDSLYNPLDSQCNPLNELTDSKYDLNGNLIQNNQTQFRYDSLGRLVQCGDCHYVYDALGRCLSKESDKTTHYLYDGLEEIGTDDQFRILDLSGRTLGIEVSEHYYPTLTDIQHSIRLVFDQERTENIYSPFGEGEPKTPWGYQGKRWDPDSKLYRYPKRYYNPQLHRWMTPDPLGTVDSINPYQFCFNNPFNYVDPTGEMIFALPLLYWGGATVVSSITLADVALATAVVYVGAQAYYNPEVFPSYTIPIFQLPIAINNRHTPDQEAFLDLVNHSTGNGEKRIPAEDVPIIDEWGREVDFPGYRSNENDIKTENNHWIGGPHIHVKGAKGGQHVPVEPGSKLCEGNQS